MGRSRSAGTTRCAFRHRSGRAAPLKLRRSAAPTRYDPLVRAAHGLRQ
jgi:hypothetical protein